MTTNSSNPPNRPRQPHGYNPITLEDVQNSAGGPAGRDYFGELSDPVARCVAAPLLGAILLFTLRTPLLAPLLVLVLLGCLLARLDERPRQIAAAPLALAATKLAFQMANHLTSALLAPPYQRGATLECDYIWLPVFFAACLVFIPKRDSLTFKIVVAGSSLLLASGLLPGEGFAVVYYLLDGMLFVAAIAGLVVDIKSHYQPRPQPNVQPAH